MQRFLTTSFAYAVLSPRFTYERLKILQSDSHQTQLVWILSLYFDPIWRQESTMVGDFKIFASPQIVWSELTNFLSLDPYLEAPWRVFKLRAFILDFI